jgi:hypothetical protein
LCIRVSVLLSLFGSKKCRCGGSSGAHERRVDRL